MSDQRSHQVWVTVPSPRLRLEAWLHSPGEASALGRSAAVIAPPHPLYGGSVANPVVIACVEALTAAGSTCLAFNWRGVGRSEGVASGEPAAADVDYRAAIGGLPSGDSIVAAGYSFGAVAALRAAIAEPRIVRVIAIAPPAAMLEGLDQARLQAPLGILVGDEDPFAPHARIESFAAGVRDAHVRVLSGVDHFFAAVGQEALASEVLALATRGERSTSSGSR